MKATKRYKLLGESWKIKWVEGIEVPEETGCSYLFGYTNLNTHEIYVNTLDDKGKPLSNETIRITLFHELIHSIFGSGQYRESNADEPLVEWTARCIASLLDQNILL